MLFRSVPIVKLVIILMAYPCILGLSSCLDDLDLSLSAANSTTPGYSPAEYLESLKLYPGELFVDSTRLKDKNEITIYGHVVPEKDKMISIGECGFIVRNDWEVIGGKKYPIIKNAEWSFQKDTTLSLKLTIADLYSLKNYNCSLYMTVKNNLPEKHSSESYDYFSKSQFSFSINAITEAVNDSVIFIGPGKAVLWAHLKTKEDCEMVARPYFYWGPHNQLQYVIDLPITRILTTGNPVFFHDTIKYMPPGDVYHWRTIATVKYSNGSSCNVYSGVTEFRPKK